MPYDSHEQLINEVALIEQLAQRNLSIRGVENPTFDDVQEVILAIQKAVSTVDDNQFRSDILKETLFETSPLVEGHEHFKIDGKLEESLRIKAHIDPMVLRGSQHKLEFAAENEEKIREVVAVLRKLSSSDIKKFVQVGDALSGLSVAGIYASDDDDTLGEGDELDDLVLTFMEAKKVVAEACPCLGITADSRVKDIDEELIDAVLTELEERGAESLEDGILQN